jgi:hypothetical protein
MTAMGSQMVITPPGKKVRKPKPLKRYKTIKADREIKNIFDKIIIFPAWLKN